MKRMITALLGIVVAALSVYAIPMGENGGARLWYNRPASYWQDILKSASEFYQGFLYRNPKSGYMVCWSSASPENTPSKSCYYDELLEKKQNCALFFGKNTNPLTQNYDIPTSVISPRANIQGLILPATFVYDFPTKAGETMGHLKKCVDSLLQ